MKQWYEGRYGPEWLHHMRNMIDALAEGQTLEAYIQSVLAKSHTNGKPMVSFFLSYDAAKLV